ncbi:MAG: plastocyanin/azurin family copper-binding protein [Flavobacteriales bacterium]|nr:plastocyanin/azurin family copper-binding protein [Flavobacteriales bacterium]
MKKITLLFISTVLSCAFYATNHNVTTVGNTFSPANITINQGDTVTWTNGGGSHNVNATLATYPNNPEGFGNSVSSSSWTLQHIFSIPGTYDYQCDPHTGMGMVGTVVVNTVSTPSDLTFTAIMDLTTPSAGNTGKALLLTANQSISDLSIYGVGSATNGTGSDGEEYTFPAISINAGQHVIICRDSTALSNYFNGCLEQFAGALYPNLIIQSSTEPSGNGNDAYELFENGLVVETFGDITHTYGTNYPSIPWGYRDSWAWKDTAASNVGNWVFGGDNCTDGSTTIQTSNCPFPLCGSGPPVVTYNVTLEVNTASIYQNGGTVGPNGMYAGGGFVGNAMGLQLTQSTTDTLKWSGNATVIAGSGPNHYTFLNSPTNGGDWNAKENLAGLPCGDPTNYNDRLMPNIFSDTTIKHCFGSCETDGSCPPPPSSFVNITFTLNVSSIISSGGVIDPTGIFIAGGGNFGIPGDNPMTDLGNGTWSFTINKPIGFTSDYTFTNGDSGWGAKENISGLPCAVPPYDDRNLAPVYSDTTIQHCFGTCDYDGTCNSVVNPPASVNVTFQVDMSEVTDPYSVPEINATFNSWCGNCNAMSDTDNDSVWDVTIALIPGDTIEYKYSADSWTIQETNDPGASCTNGDSTYTNRVLVIPNSDMILDVVCWASCDPCVSVPPIGIEDNLNSVSIFPNPASVVINISSSQIIERIEVLDLIGRIVKIDNPNSSFTTLDISDLNGNIYFIKYTINGEVKSEKILIR